MTGSPSNVPTGQTAVLLSNLRSNERFTLRMSTVHIGRGVVESQDIVLPPDDVHASREHARLTFEEGFWFIEDLSRNGTQVNGQMLRRSKMQLKGNERIRIGDTFDMNFRYIGVTTQSDDASSKPVPAYVSSNPNEQPGSEAGLWISPSAAVWRDGERLPVFLSRTEYRLLKHLMQHQGDVCEYDTVINAVWGEQRDKDSLHELIYRVRRKIEPRPSQPKYLVIRSGIGVVLFPQGIKVE
jgi:pSer/pThr/pTyr-binding forkhead associated (FHA) protein